MTRRVLEKLCAKQVCADFLAPTSVRAARLQNESTPDFLYLTRNQFEKREKWDAKKGPKRDRKMLSPSQAVQEYFTGTSLKAFHGSIFAKRFFSPRGSAGVARLNMCSLPLLWGQVVGRMVQDTRIPFYFLWPRQVCQICKDRVCRQGRSLRNLLRPFFVNIFKRF